MFSDAEIKLLNAPAGGFPLLAATQNAWRSCGTCGHAGVNIHLLLRTAVSRYRTDGRFIELCRGLFRLPCSIAGVYMEDTDNGGQA